jgi:hypothetical protein
VIWDTVQAYDATQKEIKSRYYEVMREIHPDLSDDAEQELAHELATFLNHVYEVRKSAKIVLCVGSRQGYAITVWQPWVELWSTSRTCTKVGSVSTIDTCFRNRRVTHISNSSTHSCDWGMLLDLSVAEPPVSEGTVGLL